MQKSANRFYFWEKLALAFPIGLGAIVIVMFLLTKLVKIPLTFFSITGSLFVTAAIIGLYLLKKKAFCINLAEIKKINKFDHQNMAWWEYSLAILLAFKVIYVYFASIVKPLIDVDAFLYYSIVAKGIFFEKTFNTPYLLKHIHDKPLLPYLSQGWAFIGMHTINDALFKILFPTLFLCLLVIFYSALRKYYTRRMSMIFTFLLSTLPFLVFHVATAYGDFTMSFYYGAATIYLLLFMKSFNASDKESAFSNLLISFVLLAFAVWTKRAGIVYAGTNIFVLLTYLTVNKNKITGSDLLHAAIPLFNFFILIIPMLLYGQFNILIVIIRSILGIGNGGASAAAPAKILPPNKAGIIFSIMAKKLFLYADWHLLWALFIVSLVLFYRRSLRSPLVFLLAIIFLDVLALFVQFGTVEMFRWLLDGTIFDRLTMAYIVIITYFCAEAIIPSLKDNSLAGGTRPSPKNKKGS
ncbi:MAG: hypothetical protein U9R38_06360 [Candidatus Margulisiibacteriota bacterium]|nr:hypothetical protein [Candidatus Margulisiibacteriota bacterium]